MRCLNAGISDVELIAEDRGNACGEEWWKVWEDFIKISTLLMLQTAHKFELAWELTDNMMFDEIRVLWHPRIIKDIGFYLGQEGTDEEMRVLIHQWSKGCYNAYLDKLAALPFPPLFALFPNKVLLLLANVVH